MKKIIDIFLDFEKEFNLFDKSINSFYYWPYLRFSVYMKIEEIINKQKKSSNKKININDIFSIVLNCTIKNPLLYKSKKNIMIISHQRRVKIDDTYKCIYTDKIAEYFKNDAISLEFLYGIKHCKPRTNSNILDLDFVDIWPFIKLPLLKIKYKNDIKLIYELSNTLTKEINNRFNIKLNESYIYKLFYKRYIWYIEKKKILKKIIFNINPKIIIEVVSYETNKMIINEIAKENNIITIELQHGVIGKGHIAYNYLENRRFSHIPDRIYFWGEYWKKTCRFPIKADYEKVVGFPYMMDQLNKYPMVTKKKNRLEIIVLSQPEFSFKLKYVIKKFIDILIKRKVDFHVYYKLHPAEYNDKEQLIKEICVSQEVNIIADEYNLYELFAESNIQIGVTSTAIFEGLVYNLQTFIYHIEKTDSYMSDLVNSRFAIFFENATDLANKIFKSDNIRELDKDAFFIDDSFNKLIDEIKEEVGG
ncbi:hypothetical protein [uncultured Thomasclavelia sp.]|uniref:hypothetical protein n=1 Tax=uncultured Thomasclavelia sp. TaxID=3025759 RepID=UPI0026067ACF|nr:hypothetical protein [uncultured Thomasclavelia sp.]